MVTTAVPAVGNRPNAIQSEQQNRKPSALRSIIAGSTAGAIEIAVTYPAEFAKTRTQLNVKLADGKKLPWPPFGPQWYAGCTTLIIGNSIKAGVRFVAFDQYKQMLSSSDGTKPSNTGTDNEYLSRRYLASSSRLTGEKSSKGI